MLLNFMKYFEQYLKSDREAEALDISVSCDIKIFDWLIRYVDYMQNWQDYKEERHLYRTFYQVLEEGGKPVPHTINFHAPLLEVRNCITILISAEFLKMAQLVDESTLFIA